MVIKTLKQFALTVIGWGLVAVISIGITPIAARLSFKEMNKSMKELCKEYEDE